MGKLEKKLEALPKQQPQTHFTTYNLKLLITTPRIEHQESGLLATFLLVTKGQDSANNVNTKYGPGIVKFVIFQSINPKTMSTKDTVFTKIQLAITSILFCVALPFLFILFIVPIQIIRYVVGVLARIFRPDLVQLVSKRSSVWTKDNLRRPESNITVISIFDSKVEAEAFHSTFNTNVLQRKRKRQSSILQFQRLQQYYEYWLQFCFWKWDTNFNLNHHLKSQAESVIGKENLLKLANCVNRQEWRLKQSPWSGFLIENYFDETDPIPKSAWIFTIHHSLADAYAIQCIINSLLDGRMKLKPPFNDITIQTPNAENQRQPLLGKFIYPFKCIYILIQDLSQVQSSTLKFHSNIVKDRQILYNSQSSVPISHFDEIQSQFNVSTTSVLGAMAGGSLLKSFQRNNMNIPIPDFVHLMFPYSHPGHSRELSNYQ